MPAWRLYSRENDASPIVVTDGTNRGDWNQAPDTGVQYLLVFEPGPTMQRVKHPDGTVEHVKTTIPDAFATGFVFRGWNLPYMIFTGVDDYDQTGYGRIKTGSLLGQEAYDALWATVLADAAVYVASL